MNSLVKEIAKNIVTTVTTNGAKALSSALNAVVSLFGMIGALRHQSESEIIARFEEAWAEDPLLALKMVFHARNIRGGMGERNTAKVLYRHLAMTRPNVMKANIMYIPHFGRWDDLFCLIGTPCEADAFELIKTQFNADMAAVQSYQETGKHVEVSLLGKWLPSCNTSSEETRRWAKKTMKNFGMREVEYRKALATLRRYLEVVESDISAGRWETVKYAGVSSKAMTTYRNAFYRHDPERFAAYLESLKKGTTKINAGTLFPYDILRQYGTYLGSYARCNAYDEVLEQQWKALPNYVDSDANIMVMADTSGSMTSFNGLPMNTALSLAIYFAERNKGAFKNLFMTFSNKPEFVQLKGDTLKEKIEGIKGIVANTNIMAAMELLLDTAVKGNVPAEDMPKALVIISDMQFDSMTSHGDRLYHDAFAQKFADAGYELPNIIYWNVNATHPVFHATSDVKGVQMASGSSPALFQNVINSLDSTPLDAVLNALNDPMYDVITLPQ